MCRDGFANLLASPSEMLQHEPLRQKFPYQSAWVTPLSLSLLCVPNSTQRDRGGGDSLCTAWPPLVVPPRGYCKSSRWLPAWHADRAGPDRRARCAVTPIPGPAGSVPARPQPRLSSTYSASIRKRCLPLRSRSWPQTLGHCSQSPTASSTLCKDFSLAYFPHQLAFFQLCEAGTDVRPALLPLPRGRCPEHPARLPGCVLPGNREESWIPRPSAQISPPCMPGTLWSPCAFAPCPPGDPHSSADTKRMRCRPGRMALQPGVLLQGRLSSTTRGRGLCPAAGLSG